MSIAAKPLVFAPERTSGKEANAQLLTNNAAQAVLKRQSTGRSRWLFIVLAIALVVMILVAAGVGQMSITPAEVVASILRKIGIETGVTAEHQYYEAALWDVRFPRIALAVLVGAGLATGGVLMQGVFGNPLAEPGIVGVSSGAAAMAAMVIALGLDVFGSWTLVVGAFIGGLIATLTVYLTARKNGRTEVVTLILTGVAVNAVAGAVTALMTFLGDTNAREEIVFWQMGSLNGTRWPEVYVAAPVMIVGIAASLFYMRKLDLLALGERQARHLGVDVERLRREVIVLVAVITSAAVAFSGIIAFVGLVVPHIVRMIVGPGHKVVLPASILGGAVLLLCADTAARTLIPYADMPIGILTALVGGPFFFYLIRRTRRGAGGWS
ncbi:FecCD family ABC transporter permease [Trueperella bialowiezensis]|uniref:Probable ABC transporter permease protein HI_1471 n=1 Tax=Trueperella bialowiezensis TaxID=312285 RepID=A0A3S4YY07_9ACTO|nr:iron ABC transporter permease [Trueperella bialowiezensis]VEI13322.1 Probable ABC transporter permease protein HI_1471 [Trueperella bialowiezensis]